MFERLAIIASEYIKGTITLPSKLEMLSSLTLELETLSTHHRPKKLWKVLAFPERTPESLSDELHSLIPHYKRDFKSEDLLCKIMRKHASV